MVRQSTRNERYLKKKENAVLLPLYVASVNFVVDDNVGSLIRAAGCFGAKAVLVIGKMPERNKIKSLTGSLIDHVEVIEFKTPHALIEYTRNKKIDIVSVELTDDATPMREYVFDFNNPLCLVVGHETFGVPVEILCASKAIVYIQMPGVGVCLNAAQAANIALYEVVSQYNVTKGKQKV